MSEDYNVKMRGSERRVLSDTRSRQIEEGLRVAWFELAQAAVALERADDTVAVALARFRGAPASGEHSEKAEGDGATTFSYWRVRPAGDEVRVARDRYNKQGRPFPEHLEVVDARGHIGWVSHDEGAVIPSVPTTSFIAWIEAGGMSRLGVE